jgi:hypothetical protein
MKTCECGCGAEVNNRFVVGHNGGRPGERKPRTIFICEHCGEEFRVLMHPNNQRKACRFCSHKCRDNFRRAHKGAEHPNYKRTEIKCSVCPTKFWATATMIKNNATCSKECGRIAHDRQLVGKHPQRIKPDWRNEAKKRDGFKCRICAFSEVIHVHHIQPKRSGGKHELANLITLCPNHHAMVHAGMITAERLAAVIATPLPDQTEMPLGRVINFRK